jgi:sialic acid synthase SpsE
VALGAVAIEKHLTIARSDGGPDAAFSMEPAEFHRMALSVRRAEESMQPREFEPDRRFCKSLYAVTDMKAGEQFTRENVRAIRPGWGLPPAMLPDILGKRAKHDMSRGDPMSTEAVE